MGAAGAARSLQVRGFRGVREGGLGDFGNINVLVGRDGYGRSTVLEAVYVALTITEGVEYVVGRRGWFGLASIRCSSTAARRPR